MAERMTAEEARLESGPWMRGDTVYESFDAPDVPACIQGGRHGSMVLNPTPLTLETFVTQVSLEEFDRSLQETVRFHVGPGQSLRILPLSERN